MHGTTPSVREGLKSKNEQNKSINEPKSQNMDGNVPFCSPFLIP